MPAIWNVCFLSPDQGMRETISKNSSLWVEVCARCICRAGVSQWNEVCFSFTADSLDKGCWKLSWPCHFVFSSVLLTPCHGAGAILFRCFVGRDNIRKMLLARWWWIPCQTMWHLRNEVWGDCWEHLDVMVLLYHVWSYSALETRWKFWDFWGQNCCFQHGLNPKNCLGPGSPSYSLRAKSGRLKDVIWHAARVSDLSGRSSG